MYARERYLSGFLKAHNEYLEQSKPTLQITAHNGKNTLKNN